MSKLLDVMDAIEEHQTESQLTWVGLSEIIDKLGKVKDLPRRVRDILRVLEQSRWVVPENPNQGMLFLTPHFHNLISSWNAGNLLAMNRELTLYPPYARFVACLRKERIIRIPQRQDSKTRKQLGNRLKQNYDITFVAFDTFRIWAVSVGQAYLSPFEESLYWGGEWAEKQLSLWDFKEICRESYCQTDKTSGYANLGRLADFVCRKLSISFQAFETKMGEFIKAFPGEVKLAPATIRYELSRKFQITTIRPRRDILRERVVAKLQGKKRLPQSQWLEHRYVEDGIRVNGQLVKLIRWEAKP